MGRDLAQRAGAAVAAQAAPPNVQLLKTSINNMEKQFALAMPKGAEAVQLVRDALTALNTTKNLDKCDTNSVLGALMTCAQLGLRPGVLGHAWVLPFYSGRDKCYHAQLIIGYQGYKELAYRSGRIESMIAREVYEADLFDVDYGIADTLVHKPALTGERGTVTGYYAIIKYKGGGHTFAYLSRSDAENHMQQFASARDRNGKIFGPWVDHFDAMALKTAFLVAAKWAPKATDLANAIEADGSVRVDLSPQADVAVASTWVDADDTAGEAPADDQGVTSAPDPLTVIKKELLDVAVAQGHDVEWLKADYREWNTNGDGIFAAATLADLTEYRNLLRPETNGGK